MTPIRKKRLESAIKKEMAGLVLLRRRKDDRLGFISVVDVELASDMSRLKVYISLFGDKRDSSGSWLALQDHKYYFQSAIGRNLRLRHTPQLEIEMDESVREGDRMLDLIEAESKAAARSNPGNSDAVDQTIDPR